MEPRRFSGVNGRWWARDGALGCVGSGEYASCKRCRRWQKQQSGNRLVFQDALGQQSGCFGAIAVALRWARRRCGGQVEEGR
jgi:hypothetical protein